MNFNQIYCITYFRSIELRQLRGPEQNKMLEHLAEKLHWHGQKANSIYNKNRFLQNMDYNTVCVSL